MMYTDAYIADGWHSWARAVAVSVCALEVCLGLLLLARVYIKVCSAASLLLLSFFLWLTSINYFCPSIMGSIESCGCFGELIHFSPLGAFVKCVVLWLTSLMLCLLARKSEWNLRALLRDRFTYAALAVGLLLSMFSVLTLDAVGHGLYTGLYLGLCLVSAGCLLSKIKNSNFTKYLQNE